MNFTLNKGQFQRKDVQLESRFNLIEIIHTFQVLLCLIYLLIYLLYTI